MTADQVPPDSPAAGAEERREPTMRDVMAALNGLRGEVGDVNRKLDRLIQATPAAAIPEAVTKHVIVGLDTTKKAAHRAIVEGGNVKSTWTFVRMKREGQDEDEDMVFAVGSAHCAFRGKTEVCKVGNKPPKKEEGLMFILLPKGVVECTVKSVYTFGELSDVVGEWPAGRDIVYVHVAKTPKGIKKEDLLEIDPEGSYEKGKEQCRSAFSSTVGVSLSSLVNGARCIDFDTFDVEPTTSKPLDTDDKFFIFTTGDGAHGEGGNSGTLMFLVNNKNKTGTPLALGCFKGFWDGFEMKYIANKMERYHLRMAISPFPPFKDMKKHEVMGDRGDRIEITSDGKKYEYDHRKNLKNQFTSPKKANDSIYGVICGGFDTAYIVKGAGGSNNSGSGLLDFSSWGWGRGIFRSSRK